MVMARSEHIAQGGTDRCPRAFVKIPAYTPENIPDDIDLMYTCGRCMYLAAALHRSIGWPISVVLNDGTDDAYIDHAWVYNPADAMMFDINGCYPESRNGFITQGSVVMADLSEDELFHLTMKTSGRPMARVEWDAEVDDALVMVDQFFRSQVAMAIEEAPEPTQEPTRRNPRWEMDEQTL